MLINSPLVCFLPAIATGIGGLLFAGDPRGVNRRLNYCCDYLGWLFAFRFVFNWQRVGMLFKMCIRRLRLINSCNNIFCF